MVHRWQRQLGWPVGAAVGLSVLIGGCTGGEPDPLPTQEVSLGVATPVAREAVEELPCPLFPEAVTEPVIGPFVEAVPIPVRGVPDFGCIHGGEAANLTVIVQPSDLGGEGAEAWVGLMDQLRVQMTGQFSRRYIGSPQGEGYSTAASTWFMCGEPEDFDTSWRVRVGVDPRSDAVPLEERDTRQDMTDLTFAVARIVCQ